MLHWIPVTLMVVCVGGFALSTVIVLSLISVYLPNTATSNVCKISFKPMMSYSTGAKPMAVKTADFNNDNILDLAVANFNGNTTSIFLGQGDGTFKDNIDLWNGPDAGTNAIAIADINKDNHLDIVVANRHANNVGIFLGHGNGNFSAQTTFSTGNGSQPVAVAVYDLNNDAVLDLVVTGHVGEFVLIFWGEEGNGTFTKTLKLPTNAGAGPYLFTIGDFNRDGRPDIVVGEGDGNSLGIFLGNGSGTFSSQITQKVEGGPYALVALNLNRDGILDIVTANYDGNNTSVLFGNGDGTFTLKYHFSTGDASLPYAIALGDFNRDTIQDLIVANSGTNNVGILLGRGNGKFMKQQTYSTGNGSAPVEITVGDFNGDHKLDFVSANSKHNTIGVFLSTCS